MKLLIVGTCEIFCMCVAGWSSRGLDLDTLRSGLFDPFRRILQSEDTTHDDVSVCVGQSRLREGNPRRRIKEYL